ncbi:hypothetical protein ACIQV3_36300 [Streptomyces sp. NPDC099050]|uniref:hypothetical protein n=1 Tax=Streptomyces sp. NPDC099050 TaxID=3366100 RepID=UPI00382B4ED1
MTRPGRGIEPAHERAIERGLEWIEDEIAVIRYGKDGIEWETEYVTAVNDDGELKYLPAVSERARVELMRILNLNP